MEKNIWYDFYVWINNKKLEPIPQQYKDEEHRLGMRFLASSHFDFQRAHNAIFENKSWQSHSLPIDPAPLQKFLDAGFIYICGRAHPGFQPVVIMNGRKFQA